jgi:hypothetical protein
VNLQRLAKYTAIAALVLAAIVIIGTIVWAMMLASDPNNGFD